MWISIIINLYNLIFILLLPALLLRFFLKSLKLKAYKHRLTERLGVFKVKEQLTSKCNVWIHAVSVGEIMAAIPIIKKIKSKFPASNIILTCTTPRGSEIIQQKLTDLVLHVYLPFDISFAIENFLNKFNPKLLILIEKELWPNLIWHCNLNRIPIIIANAQLSNKSFKRYLLFKPLMQRLLSNVYCICTQTGFDTYKFKQLISEANYDKIITTGNIKFDLATEILNFTQPVMESIEAINHQENLIWIAASTHPIEEKVILQAHKLILSKLPTAVLILAPRHPERINLIIKDVLQLNFTYQQHSVQSIFITPRFNAQIYIVDSIGELNKFYQISQVAFVGGSLIPNIGGHNVLEAAAFAKPIIVGPYTANCQKIVSQLKAHNGLKIINNAEELAIQVLDWVSDINLCLKIGENAKNYLIKEAGVVDKIIRIVDEVLIPILNKCIMSS